MVAGARRIAGRTRRGFAFLDVADVWAFEARGRLCVVHSARGPLDVDLSLVEVAGLLGASFVRVHRNWLANIANVRELVSHGRTYSLRVGVRLGDESSCVVVPIARGQILATKERLLAGTVGVRVPQRRRRRRPVTNGLAMSAPFVSGGAHG